MRRSRATSIGLLGLSSALLVGLAAALPDVASAAHPPSAEGKAMAAATDNGDATHAALSVIRAGGSAADGAIAAALALGVVNPSASGLGGGGFAMVYSARDGKVSVLDFRETAGKKVDAAGLDAPFKMNAPRPAAIGVPGEPAGLEELHARFGRVSLAAAAAPAVALARDGFWVGHHSAGAFRTFKDRIAAMTPLAGAFLPGGNPAGYATLVKRPDLAASIARFGATGKRDFYDGPIAAEIVAAARAAGSPLTAEDLRGYVVRQRQPLTRTHDGRTIYTMPAPSAGGLMLLEVLGMYGASKSSPLVPMGFGSSAYLHTVAEGIRGAWADRVRVAGDPDRDPSVMPAFERALAPAQLAARRARISADKTHPAVEFKTKEQGTSHLIVTDPEGNVVSMTTTINGPFGAAVMAGKTGIILNNELDDFSDAKLYATFGVKGPGPNLPRPLSRPVSSMTPTIVLEGGKPILAVGGSGGPRIATGTLQATLCRLLFERDPNACVSAPRVHTTGGPLMVEPDIAVDVRQGLTTRGETVKDEPWIGSSIQMVAWEGADRKILAATDPRKAGMAAAR
ncbi:MAG: gamma-glutamyltransferase [Myxococcales bacterium]|nr:gamma-glutamyltransferase [Myxococcales bacterium]